MALNVNEIFYSIQGESGYAGWPSVFVRLSGCNLRCTYCDTQYAYDEGESLDIQEILDRVGIFSSPMVEITGGEPLIHNETPQLAVELLNLGYTVLLETNGSQNIARVDPRCIKIVDFKCPSSGASGSNDLANIDRMQAHDEVKCVIGNKEDYHFARDLVPLIHKSSPPLRTINFSPVFGCLDPRELAEWILADRLNVRLNLQLHKYIWGPDRRGV